MKKPIFYALFTVLLFNYLSTNAQPTTWTTTGRGGGGSLYSPSINPANPNEIYMGCDMTELFHTTNQGATWTEKPFQQIQGGLYSEVQFTRDPTIRYCVNHAAKDNVDRTRPFKSDDGGETWYPLIAPLDPASGVVRLFVDYNSPSRVVLVDYAQIFLSINGGGDFTRIFNTAASNIGNHVAGVCFDGNSIYICCEDGIYYSTDSGTTWNWLVIDGIASGEKILSFTSARTGDSLKFVCLTALRVWAGIRPGSTYWDSMHGIFTMMNANGHWKNHTSGISAAAGDFVAWLGMAQNDTSTIYAAGGDGYLKPIVMKSVNSQAWEHKFLTATNQNVSTGWAGEHGDGTWDYGSAPQGFQVCPSNPNIVVTTDLGFTHITTDGGTTWKQMYLSAADQNPSGVWTPRKKAYHSSGLENTGAWQLAWLDNQKIMASFTDIGGITSLDGGDSWKYTAILENTTYKIIKHTDNKVYAATSTIHDMYQSTKIYNAGIDNGGGKLYVSTDNGTTFSVLKDFLHPVIWIATDPNNASIMYAAIVHSDPSVGGIYQTVDLQNGTAAIWTKLPTPTRGNGHPFNVHVLNNGDLLATFSAHVPLVTDKFTATSGVFYFDKLTQTWTDKSHTNMRFWTKDVTIDPADATQSTWYVAVFQGWGDIAMQGTGGLYKTTNRGTTWTKISNEFRVNAATVHPNNPNLLYYTTETNGLWYSTNATAATPTFNRVENYTFRHPMRVFFNPYNLQEVWVTSFGNGIKKGIDPTIVVLPIELTDFKGIATPKGNVLTWSFANSKDLNTLTVEKSKDAVNFIPCRDAIYRVSATQDITQTQDAINRVSTIDESPFDITYYRLKLTELDGKSSFSKIIAVNRENTEGSKKRLNVYPNPATDELTIENAEGQTIEIVNSLGQVVLKSSSIINHLLNINHLKSGIYFVKTRGEMVRFVKN